VHPLYLYPDATFGSENGTVKTNAIFSTLFPIPGNTFSELLERHRSTKALCFREAIAGFGSFDMEYNEVIEHCFLSMFLYSMRMRVYDVLNIPTPSCVHRLHVLLHPKGRGTRMKGRMRNPEVVEQDLAKQQFQFRGMSVAHRYIFGHTRFRFENRF
jgi:hypothetical protein